MTFGATRIAAAGTSFDVLDLGAGAPVLFLHGALGDLRTFAPHCRSLAPRYRALTYTQRWFGTTPWPETGPPFGVSEHADDLIALIDALRLAPLSLVAWSYAGHVALTAAMRRPEQFRGVLIYEPGFATYVTDPDEMATFRAEANAMFGPIGESLKAGDTLGAARHLMDFSAHRMGFFDAQPQEQLRIQIDNAHMMPRLMTQTPPPRITCAQLGALSTPVTVVHGAATWPFFAIVSRAAARCIGGDSHRIVPGAGHMWPTEDANAFVALVASWLDGSPCR